jgi:uncharacterized membrane protein YeaQ/YmgE (transglycosylase-associated protein family)
MNVVAWLAFGAIAGYTAFHLSPVDPSIGPEGHALLAIAGAFVGGLAGALVLGIDPFALRIDMATASTGVVGAVVAVVGREESRRRLESRRRAL